MILDGGIKKKKPVGVQGKVVRHILKCLMIQPCVRDITDVTFFVLNGWRSEINITVLEIDCCCWDSICYLRICYFQFCIVQLHFPEQLDFVSCPAYGQVSGCSALHF